MNKEFTNITYNDIAPSLQAMLGTKALNSDYGDMQYHIDNIKNRFQGISIGSGPTSNRPVAPENNKAVYFNTDDKVLEYYSDGEWKRRSTVFI